MITLTTHQAKPADFVEHSFTKQYELDHSEPEIWKWLNNPKSFTDTQIWPFRVEFLRLEDQHHDFEPGVFNSHHGPFMSFTGIIGEITPDYRDLKYLYGSYFLSFRWIRPHRLQFWTKSIGDKTILTMQLDTYVRKDFEGFWNWGQSIFWKGFGKTVSRGISKSK